jgi:hypothetical protein
MLPRFKLKDRPFFALIRRGCGLAGEGLVMKFVQLAAITAAMMLLAAPFAGAQPSPEQPGPAPSGPAQSSPPAVANTNVNLRQGPGTTYTIIATIPAGAPVQIGNCEGQWCQVNWQGQNGYVIATSVGQGGAGPPPGGAPPPGPGPVAVYPGAPPPGYYPPGYYPPGYYPPPPPYYGPDYYGYGPYYRHGYYHRW